MTTTTKLSLILLMSTFMNTSAYASELSIEYIKNSENLILATEYGNIEMVRDLLTKEDIDVNIKQVTQNLNVKCFDYSEDSTPLMRAAKWNNIAMINLLLGIRDIDVNVQKSLGETVLSLAVEQNNLALVDLLLKHGGFSEDNLSFALNTAANIGNREIFMLLLNSGINIKQYGGRVLMTAVENGYIDIVNILMNADADLTFQNQFGETALICATTRNNVEMVRLLLNSERDIGLNFQERHGATALMEAARNGHIDIVTLLLNASADAALTDSNGKTAADFTENSEIKALILEFLALSANHIMK